MEKNLHVCTSLAFVSPYFSEDDIDILLYHLLIVKCLL
jgi:hypothetical protein